MTTLVIGENKFVKITYGALVAVATFLVALTFWMATLQSNASITAEKINNQEDVNRELLKTIHDIDKRTVRIETMMKDKQ